ncbi:MAG: TIGR04002 family protein [Oscillospiraceae bacterium]|nr:TIGR04002 family protein [Oscillospiraceae bacterium]
MKVKMRYNFNIKPLVLSALFAAIITTLTFFGKIPVANGYIHIGDSIIYIAACVLPFPYALFAAGFGGALADALGGYTVFILPTFIIKALLTLLFTPKANSFLTKRNAFMVLPAGLITVTGYLITGWFIYGEGAFAGIIGDCLQGAGSGILFITFAVTLDKIRFKQRLTKQ